MSQRRLARVVHVCADSTRLNFSTHAGADWETPPSVASKVRTMRPSSPTTKVESGQTSSSALLPIDTHQGAAPVIVSRTGPMLSSYIFAAALDVAPAQSLGMLSFTVSVQKAGMIGVTSYSLYTHTQTHTRGFARFVPPDPMTNSSNKA